MESIVETNIMIEDVNINNEDKGETTQAAKLLCLFSQVDLPLSSKKRSYTEFKTESLIPLEYGHDSQGAYKCDVIDCYYASRKSSALAAHKMKIHGKKEVFPCTYCGDIFTLSDTRNKHIKRKHTQEKSYQCTLCEKKFFTKQELDNHFNSRHICTQKLKCSNCDLTFTTIRTLNVHQKKQHGIKQFKCDKCESSFAYRYELHNHRCKKLKEITSIVSTNNNSTIPIMPLNLDFTIQSLPNNPKNVNTTSSIMGFNVNDLNFNSSTAALSVS